ncbi:PREDICTED: putative hexokinase HKDC1 [Rhagoletis zephyria]|uniref:putative hexokinase HKDC1 n=1 Tax=Rhagoletis zephyria TaxID=28612 RepID=UPI00081137DC|nr:PREDICTED: putative hexokinase HKDC1 [Rhagoletis zephyria]
MVNTFVPALQSLKREELTGEYVSLDIGSSNFRVLYSRLRPKKAADVDGKDDDHFEVKYYDIPVEYRKGSSSRLFNFLAQCITSFLDEVLPPPSPETTNTTPSSTSSPILPLGFTFSFPMTQQAINSGRLTTWTKNFDLPDAVNADPALLLQTALDATGNAHSVRVVALLNDSTGTLLKGSYLDGDCAIGLIMGTGSNACYLERMDQIKKWTNHSAQYAHLEEVLVNMECGAFGDNECIDFVRTKYDRQLDQASLFPKSFTFEKYLGGQFLGETLRLILLDLVEHRLLLGGLATEQLRTVNSIKTSAISEIEAEGREESLRATAGLLQSLGYRSPSAADLATVQWATARVSIRVASLLAAVVATLVRRMKRPRTVVAVDGSVYKRHPKMRLLMADFIDELLLPPTATDGNGQLSSSSSFPRQRVELIGAEDGSGKGAGIAAALASKLQLY